MSHPKVIVSVIASADGKIALSRQERLLDHDTDRRWKLAWPPDVAELTLRRDAAIEAAHRPSVILEGSGSFVADDAPPIDNSLRSSDHELFDDFLPHRTPKWFAVVDGRGRVPWQFAGDAERSLLVIVCRSTPAAYLATLREKRIPYLLVGQDRVDLRAAVVRLGELGTRSAIVSNGGGGLNGALLGAGLVDEVHLITVPAVIGGLGTPSIFDGEPLGVGSIPVSLQVSDVVVGDGGSIWTHYIRPGER